MRRVAGEPVAVHDAARRGSSLSQAQRQAGEGRLLWVTGFTLSADLASDTAFDNGPKSRAMVVFQQLSGTEMGDRRRLALLRDRAVIATEMSFTITDPRGPDHPLVWVNPSFTRLTGYSLEEVVGRNCRLLQGPNTDPAAVRRIGDALRRREPITEVLLNYRRDGTAYWNQVSISPVTDGDGEVVNFVGVQNDVTERVIVEQERRAATTQMTGALDVADACDRLARIVVPALADLCAVDLVDQPSRGAARVRCPPGSLLLLYTDGLTDVAGDDADTRTAALEHVVATVPPGSDAETVVEKVLGACPPEPLRDDVALLAVRLTS